MARTNISPETSTAITLPFTLTVDPESNTDELFWHLDATALDAPTIGVFAYGAGTYKPKVWIYRDDGETSHMHGWGQHDLPLKVPTVSGHRYYITITGASGSAYSGGQTFTFEVYRNPALGSPVGSLCIPDDTGGYPGSFPESFTASILSRTTGDFIATRYFIDCEKADVVPSGNVLALGSSTDALHLYDPQLTALKVIDDLDVGTASVVRGGFDNRFYIGNIIGADYVKVLTRNAELETTLSIGARSCAPNAAGTKLYYNDSAATGASIKIHDIVSDTAIGTLDAGVATYRVVDIIALPGDSICAVFAKTGDNFIRRYPLGVSAADGSQSYTDIAFGTQQINHITPDINGSFFWVWSFLTVTNYDRFQYVGTDGVIYKTFDLPWFNAGVTEQAITATPIKWGPSFSCPFFVLRKPLTLPDPCCPCDCPPAAVAGPAVPPSALPQGAHAGDILTQEDPSSWDPRCAGGGDVPSAADATDAESWVS